MAFFNPGIEKFVGVRRLVGLRHLGHTSSIRAGVNPLKTLDLSYNLAGKSRC